jgi:primosomal protein N' (replication factor Y)
MSYAEILLPLPIEHAFTYSIPEVLEGRVQLGSRVLVPFGRRRLTGCVVGIGQHSPVSQVKEIIEILDEIPSLNPNLLELTQWIGMYYFAPWGEVMKAALPGTMFLSPTQYLYITEKGKLALQHGLTEEPTGAILTFLASKKRIRKDHLIKVIGSKKAGLQIDLLLEKGWIDAEWQTKKTGIRSKAGDIMESFLEEEPEPARKELTPDQEMVLAPIAQTIEGGQFKVFLLQGVTGSGKTEIYLQAIALTVEKRKQALILVPEIALTSRLMELVKGRFGDRVAILHSSLHPGERKKEWVRIRDKEVDVVIGARSAIFAPFDSLGLIIVDEEHDSSYKQEENPRYNARDIAVMRGKLTDSLVILGSATPSLESFFNARNRKFESLVLPRRILGRPLPTVEIVDLREEKRAMRKQILLSGRLKEAIEERIARGEQTILFLNRRGFASFIQCSECGFVFQCLNCDISLTYYRAENLMRCHYCDEQIKVTDTCPQCRGMRLLPFGLGTQRLEEEVRRIFSSARIARLDRDISRKWVEVKRILAGLRDGSIDILVGTQLIAKGHDYPRITLVGVISADTSLNIPDFRAGERTYQLLTQVAGRAGRGTLRGEVIIQTYNPQHYAIQSAKAHDYQEFCHQELEFRRRLNYPPFSRMIAVKIESPNE